jgi:hypothetical protein
MQWRYNSFENKWDLCSEFDPEEMRPPLGGDMFNDDDQDDPENWGDLYDPVETQPCPPEPCSKDLGQSDLVTVNDEYYETLSLHNFFDLKGMSHRDHTNFQTWKLMSDHGTIFAGF